MSELKDMLLEQLKDLDDRREEEGRYGSKLASARAFGGYMATRDISAAKGGGQRVSALLEKEQKAWDAFEEERSYGTKDSAARAYGAYLAIRNAREKAGELARQRAAQKKKK